MGEHRLDQVRAGPDLVLVERSCVALPGPLDGLVGRAYPNRSSQLFGRQATPLDGARPTVALAGYVLIGVGAAGDVGITFFDLALWQIR